MMNYWKKGDNASKDFVSVMKDNGDNTYSPAPIQSLVIGQPCLLKLPSGDIVRTSKVQSWTLIGGMRINTASRTYYAVKE